MNPELPVWRLEFQLRREVLVQLGIRSFASLIQNQGGIWGYRALRPGDRVSCFGDYRLGMAPRGFVSPHGMD